MLVVTLRHLNYRYPKQTKDILTDINVTIQSHSKIGLIGNNGCGKSSLLHLVKGEISPNSGQIDFVQPSVIAYLPQEIKVMPASTISDYCWSMQPELSSMKKQLDIMHQRGAMSMEQAGLYDDFYQAGGYEFEANILAKLKQFDFNEGDLARRISSLSGGEQTKLGLCAVTLLDADLLLFDEPSNHLDAGMLQWLETYLQNLTKPFLLISHDRHLLNSCVTEIVAIDNGHSQHFSGNYDFYKQQTYEHQQQLIAAQEKNKKKIKQLQHAAVQREQWSKVKQMPTRSVTKTGRICKRDDGSLPASKEKLTYQVAAVRARIQHAIAKQQAEKPFVQKQRKLISNCGDTVSNKIVLYVKGLSKTRADKMLFSQLDFELARGDRLAIVGDNGCGKTTLLRILIGSLTADAGEVCWSPQVKFAYYDQLALNLDPEKTALDSCQDYCDDETLIRTTLGQLFFTAALINMPIKSLSPGERAKLALTYVLLQPSNVLILDEPCNHLELAAREALEVMLMQYTGSIIFVSHDRVFCDRIATAHCHLLKNR